MLPSQKKERPPLGAHVRDVTGGRADQLSQGTGDAASGREVTYGSSQGPFPAQLPVGLQMPVHMRKVIPGTHCDNPLQQTALSQPGDLAITALFTPRAPGTHQADGGSGDGRGFRPHFPRGLKDSTRVSVSLSLK